MNNFVERAKALQGDKYNYSETTGTMSCVGGSLFNKEVFIEKAQAIHGDKYDYSRSVYKDSVTKLRIRCFIHGYFEQRPYSHWLGKNCPLCARKARTGTTEKFIKKAQEVHGDRYDYSQTVFVKQKVRLIIKCKKHGYFSQTPANHLNLMAGCHECGKIKAASRCTKNTEVFIKKALAVHGQRYDYSKTVYTKATNELTIVCKKHGKFLQKAYKHYNGHGCPSCSSGRSELVCRKILEEILEAPFNKARPSFLQGLEYDGFNSDLELAFEYNGKQHYEIVPHFHRNGEADLLNQKHRDQLKRKRSEEAGVKLIEIPYIYNYEDIDVLKEYILNQLERLGYIWRIDV